MPSFKIHTFGCKVNLYESEALRERLLREGYVEAKGRHADCHFVNTCAVTAVAESKDRKKVRQIRREDPDAKIAVLGCSSQIHPEDYLGLDVQLVTGTSAKGQVECLLRNAGQKDRVLRKNRALSYDDTPIERGEHAERAYVKVQDGCDNFCAYCVVPFARGNSRSRGKESVLKECDTLLKAGVKEIVIGGIDTGSYQDPGTGERLCDLLSSIARLPYDFRVRLSSIEASQIDDRLIALFATSKVLCPHFHIPLQSGSAKILKRMNRKYDLDAFLHTVEKIRAAVPNVAFSTDVITGFPGETEEDFMDTFRFCQKVGFMRIHAFPYSERPFTRALSYTDKVPLEERQERVRRLIELSDRQQEAFRKSLHGKTVRVLVEKKEKDGFFYGYSENYLYLPVRRGKALPATFADVVL